MEAEGPVPGSGLRGVADVGNSTWPLYKPLDGRRENGNFALLNSNMEAFCPLVYGVPKSNIIKKKWGVWVKPQGRTQRVFVVWPHLHKSLFPSASLLQLLLGSRKGTRAPEDAGPMYHGSRWQGNHTMLWVGKAFKNPLFPTLCQRVHLSPDQILGANSTCPQT